MWRELKQAFNIVSGEQSSLRCIVVRGADGNFAAGADIAEFPVEHGDTATVSGCAYPERRILCCLECALRFSSPTRVRLTSRQFSTFGTCFIELLPFIESSQQLYRIVLPK